MQGGSMLNGSVWKKAVIYYPSYCDMEQNMIECASYCPESREKMSVALNVWEMSDLFNGYEWHFWQSYVGSRPLVLPLKGQFFLIKYKKAPSSLWQQ